MTNIGGIKTIGFGASAIVRVDATILSHYTLFIAGVYSHMTTNNQSTPIGTEQGQNIGAAALVVGAGYNINYTR